MTHLHMCINYFIHTHTNTLTLHNESETIESLPTPNKRIIPWRRMELSSFQFGFSGLI